MPSSITGTETHTYNFLLERMCSAVCEDSVYVNLLNKVPNSFPVARDVLDTELLAYWKLYHDRDIIHFGHRIAFLVCDRHVADRTQVTGTVCDVHCHSQ